MLPDCPIEIHVSQLILIALEVGTRYCTTYLYANEFLVSSGSSSRSETNTSFDFDLSILHMFEFVGPSFSL